MKRHPDEQVQANRERHLAKLEALLAAKKPGDPGHQELWDRTMSYRARCGYPLPDAE